MEPSPGSVTDPVTLDVFPLIRWRRNLAVSLIGGIPDTQEMLEFCAEHGFACDRETIDESDQ
jgi:alcohol dehydrogenase (NADP+)